MSGRGDGRHVLLLAQELAKQTPPSSPGKGGKGKLTQNSKGRANGWIAYPFINTIHFAINNAVKSLEMCLIKAHQRFDEKTKKSTLCCIL
jgi:hypothetical protein